MRTHYDNLHISEKASPEVIRAAYKALAQKWHPDKNPDQREKAERYFKIITQAFDVLSDPALRARYDAWLKEKRSAEPEKPEPEATKEPPQQNSDQTRMTEAWEDGKRSREQGFKENDCPYDGALAGAWQQGFKSGQKVSTPHDAAPRPWPRFFARLIDTLTLGFASMFLVSFMAAFLFGVDISAYFSGSWIAWFAAVSGCLVITEAFLVHRLATTPGKWLFGIRVYFHDGTKLSFNNSLERAASALIIGQAANIPGLSVITSLIAYSRLKKTGTTFWDKQSKSRVECTPMSAGRVTACIIATLTAVLANSVLVGSQIKESAGSAIAGAQSLQTEKPLIPHNEGYAQTEEVAWLDSVHQAEQWAASGVLPVVAGTYVQGLPGNSGLWPSNATGEIESKSIWWAYGGDSFRVKISNTSVYSLRTVRFEFDAKPCGASSSPRSFYITLTRDVGPGESALISFPNSGQELSSEASNCLVISGIWDQS